MAAVEPLKPSLPTGFLRRLPLPSSELPLDLPSAPGRAAGEAPALAHAAAVTLAGAAGCGLLRRARRTALRAKTILKPGEKVVGIDLGTTNSAVAALEAGKPAVVANAEGERTTPSVVAWSKEGDLLVGQIAKRQAVVNPTNTFYSVKRFVGRQASEVQQELREVSYKVEAQGSYVRLDCPHLGRRLAPEEIGAQVLRKLTNDAAEYLKADISKAVVTVPAYFNDSQRQATKDAGTIGGLQVLRILNEPTAASLAYGLEKNRNETIMVFDLGGGTFDVSVLVVGDGVCEVLATNGDSHLGGDDFDKCVVDWLNQGFMRLHGMNLADEPQALQRLTEAAEKAKMELSDREEAQISLPFIAIGPEGPLSIEEALSRSKFEELTSKLVERCRGPVEQALFDADLTAKDLNEVVLVGGSTRIPAVQKLAKQLGGGRTPNQSVNPDEVVAIGAAIQAGVLTGEVRDLVLLDVIPLTLGLKTFDGLVSMFMPRNSRVPMKKTKTFATAKDNQQKVEVRVVQGERKFAKDNKELGLFLMDGIAQGPAGRVKVDVTFDVDSNGILNVTAQDNQTGKSQAVTISGMSTLAPEDIEEKVRQAQEVAAQEAWMREQRLAKNEAEAAVYAVEEVLKKRGRKMKKADLEILESKIMLVKEEVVRADASIELLKEIAEDLRESAKEEITRQEKDKYDVEQGFAKGQDVGDEDEMQREIKKKRVPL